MALVFGYAYFGYRFEFIKIPGMGNSSYPLYLAESIPITVGWMLVVINGVNLIDGIDGLAGSATSVIFAAIAVLAMNLPQPDFLVAGVALAALGGTLGFLVFNWRPAKIYMGDTGSLAIGTLIATLLIALGQRDFPGTSHTSGVVPDGSFDEPYSYQLVKITLVVFYPIMEIVLSVARRFLSGKPIGSGDKGHIHHRLLRWGWTAPMVCGVAMAISAIAASVVVAAQLKYNGLASGILLALGVFAVMLMHFCGYLEMVHPKSIRGNRPHFLIANHIISAQRIKLEHLHNLGEIGALVGQTCIEFGVKNYSMTIVPGGSCTQPLDLNWSKPEFAHGSFLLTPEAAKPSGVVASFADKAALPSGSHAAWTFEPHDVEDEIDVEYRVLMSDFMRKALGCAEYLCWNRASERESARDQQPGITGVSSQMLRRRKTGSTRVRPDDLRGSRDSKTSEAHGE